MASTGAWQLIGKAKAVVATAAKIARILYLMIRNGTPYEESGCAAYEQRYRDRVLRNLQQRAKAFGFSLVPDNSSTETSATGGAVC